jgi:hypothetical protein
MAAKKTPSSAKAAPSKKAGPSKRKKKPVVVSLGQRTRSGARRGRGRR